MSWSFTLRFPPADLVLVHELGLPDDPSSIWVRERLSVRTSGDLELTWEGFGQTGAVTGQAPPRDARRFADLLRTGGFPDFPSAPLVPGASVDGRAEPRPPSRANLADSSPRSACLSMVNRPKCP